MPDSRRARCKVCKRHRDEVGLLTWRGYCAEHAAEALESNIDQMHARRGPNFDRWRRSMAACVGGVLLDDAPRNP